MQGIVKWFKEELGYGFIVDKSGNNYFVHYSGISSDKRFKKLYPLQMVEFDLGRNDRGEIAVNVTVVDASEEEIQEYIDILVGLGYDMRIANDRLAYVKKRDKFYKGGNRDEQPVEEVD